MREKVGWDSAVCADIPEKKLSTVIICIVAARRNRWRDVKHARQIRFLAEFSDKLLDCDNRQGLQLNHHRKNVAKYRFHYVGIESKLNTLFQYSSEQFKITSKKQHNTISSLHIKSKRIGAIYRI